MKKHPKLHRMFGQIFRVSGVLLFFVGETMSAERPAIVVRTRASVKGESITLATLVERGHLAPTLIAPLERSVLALSPPLGKSREFSSEEILRRLEAQGFTEANCAISIPPVVKVERESLTVRADEIEAKVVNDFIPRLQWERIQLQSVEIPEPVLLPKGKVSMVCEASPHTDFAKPFFLKVGFVVDGHLEKTHFYRTQLKLTQSVPIAARDLLPSDKVTSEDVRWEERTLESTVRRPIADLSALQSRRPRQTIVAGRTLTEDLFLAVPLVKRGENVILLFQSDKIRVTAEGKCLESGVKGDRIRVMNVDSRMELQAEILDDKTVRVASLSQ
ncbi:MAG: flagellar basal body P-ring formation chaperone FlgA [Terriglobia bacterium]